jgi:hypothetical protein
MVNFADSDVKPGIMPHPALLTAPTRSQKVAIPTHIEPIRDARGGDSAK